LICLLNAYTLEILSSYSILASAAAAAKPSTDSLTYTNLFGAPAPTVRNIAKAPTTIVKARPVSANRTRPKSASSGVGNNVNSMAGDVAMAGAASNALGKGNGGAKKLVFTAPKDTWVRPGVKEEKEEDQALEGVKGSSNVIGLSVVVAGGSLQSVVIVTGFGKAMNIATNFRLGSRGRGPTAGGGPAVMHTALTTAMDTLFYFHYGPLWAAAVMDRPFNDVNTFVTGGDDRWLCLWDANTLSAGTCSDLLSRVKTPAPIRCLDINTIFTADTGISKLGNLFEMSVAVGSVRGRLSVYIMTARRQRSAGNTGDGSSLVRKHGPQLEYQILLAASRKDHVDDIRYASRKLLCVFLLDGS
jgi:hypothetical protein